MSLLPLEIVRETIETAYYLDAPLNRLCNLQDIGVSSKPAWKTLAAMSCASHAFREIALEVWFRILRVASPEDLEYGCQFFPRVSQWTRLLHCHFSLPSHVGQFNLVDLQALSVVRVDNSILYRRYVVHVGSPLELFLNIPPRVVQVHINTAGTMVFPPHPLLFKSMSSFTNIQTLRLVTKFAWCDLCNLDQAVVLRRPFPQTLIYEGGKAGLPIRFRKILSCLKHLETVSFTTNVFQPTWTLPNSGVALGDDQQWWSGECEDCIHVVLSDETFRSRWVALKTGGVEEIEGSGGKKYQFHPIPSLKRVEWYFPPGSDAETEENIEEDEESSSARDSDEGV